MSPNAPIDRRSVRHHPVNKDHLEPVDPEVPKDNVVTKALLVPKVLRAHKVSKETKDLPVLVVPPVPLVPQVPQVYKVPLEPAIDGFLDLIAHLLEPRKFPNQVIFYLISTPVTSANSLKTKHGSPHNRTSIVSAVMMSSHVSSHCL
jgi:hypothetical protein